MVDLDSGIRGDELVLEVEGVARTGWEKMSLTRRLEAASGSFELEVSDTSPFPILPGAQIKIEVAGEPLLDGFVDELDGAGGTDRRQWKISGRDRTADLVDCSETSEPAEFTGIIVQDLVAAIAAPFDVTVRSEAQRFGQEPFVKFTRQPGETAWSAIERACRLRGLLCFTEGSGNLVLSKPASRLAQVDLTEGPRGNVKSWAVKVSRRGRFSTYTVDGQRRGGDEASGAEVSEIRGIATDPEIGRFRPLLVLAEGALTFESAQDRAAWEATVRAARSATVTVKVQGWRQVSDGRLWRLNELVPVVIPGAQLDQTLLTNELKFTRDRDSGTVTTITLTRRDAYVPMPIVDQTQEAFEDLFAGAEVELPE